MKTTPVREQLGYIFSALLVAVVLVLSATTISMITEGSGFSIIQPAKTVANVISYIPWFQIVCVIVFATLVFSVIGEILLPNIIAKNFDGDKVAAEAEKKNHQESTITSDFCKPQNKNRLIFKLSRTLPPSISDYHRLPNETFVEMIGLVTQLIKLDEEENNLTFTALDYECIGDALFLGVNYDDALKYFKKALDIKPRDPFILFSKGITLGRLKKHQDAIDIFNEVLEIDPTLYKVLVARSYAQLKLKKYGDAIKSCERALSIKGNSCRAWNNMGLIYINTGYDERSIECFNKALKINPLFPWAYYNKARYYAHKEDKERAIKFLARAIEIDVYLKKIARIDKDFQDYQDNPEFIALFETRLKEDSFDSYEHQKTSGYSSGMMIDIQNNAA